MMEAKNIKNNFSGTMAMVVLPQNVWEETTKKLDNLIELVSSRQPLLNVNAEKRIPIVQFKTDIELRQKYGGISYSVIREAALAGDLVTFHDPGRTRYAWTTHRELMNYFERIKNQGIVK